mgnify:FL=1
MLIRNYVNKDINGINELGKLLHKNYQFYKDEFLNCVVVEENNKIIGFATYSIIYERGEIVDIIIKPKMRFRGYGSKLLNFIVEMIRKNGCVNITLEVNSTNVAAINLYNKLGFEVVAVRKKYYGENDGYLMKKDLR